MMFAQSNNQPWTRERQELSNHLILGIAMWISATVTCIITLLTVGNAWSLLVLLIPFSYTMFPQIQKSIANAREHAVNVMKAKRQIEDGVQLEMEFEEKPVENTSTAVQVFEAGVEELENAVNEEEEEVVLI